MPKNNLYVSDVVSEVRHRGSIFSSLRNSAGSLNDCFLGTLVLEEMDALSSDVSSLSKAEAGEKIKSLIKQKALSFKVANDLQLDAAVVKKTKELVKSRRAWTRAFAHIMVRREADIKALKARVASKTYSEREAALQLLREGFIKSLKLTPADGSQTSLEKRRGSLSVKRSGSWSSHRSSIVGKSKDLNKQSKAVKKSAKNAVVTASSDNFLVLWFSWLTETMSDIFEQLTSAFYSFLDHIW